MNTIVNFILTHEITTEEFNSIILSNPELPSDMPDWFSELFTVRD